MTPTPLPSAPATPRPDLRVVRAHVTALSYDLCSGQWAPTGLERRVAGILTLSAAAHGTLTAVGLRNALWEGNLAMTTENGGHFARVLAVLLSLLDTDRDGERADDDLVGPDVLDVLDEAADLCTAIASTETAAA
ncbi:hypothetical protein [Streptomyces sp. NPDC056061]|uniref:hypothetical protein n=1 Tax=Streptomyces sp. NPDC056061 TaxID=3345700 RepID=UPI0035E3821E